MTRTKIRGVKKLNLLITQKSIDRISVFLAGSRNRAETASTKDCRALFIELKTKRREHLE